MTKSLKRSVQSTSKALSRLTLFGPSPLLAGEDPAAYDELLARVSGAVNPSGAVEELWTYDVAYITWEIFRLRRLKMSFWAKAVSNELEHILAPLVDEPSDDESLDGYAPTKTSCDETESEELARKWAAGNPRAIKRIDKLLAYVNSTMDAVIAGVLLEQFVRIERIDRLIAIGEERRNAVLREIERHRATFAQTLRGAVRQVEDAEFETIEEPKAVAPRSVSTPDAA